MTSPTGPLSSLYFHELLWLITGICTNCETIFRETDPPTDGHFIKVDPEIHARIAMILTNAANVKKLLTAPAEKPKGQKAELFNAHEERAEGLRTALKDIELVEMFNVKVRNSIEHFDQYLDEANMDLLAATSPPAPLAAYNMTFSSWDLMTPRPYPVRLYVADERKFYNLKHSVDLGKLYEEASAVRNRLLTTPPIAGMQPGGLMVTLGPRPADPNAEDPITIRQKRR